MKATRRPGLYLIENRKDGKVYIGSSLKPIRRWQQHRYRLRRNDHPTVHLQEAWNRDGEAAFVFRVIATIEPSCLREHEGRLLTHMIGPRCYNIADDPVASGRGRSIPQEMRDRIRLALKGRPTGRVVTEETRAKLRARQAVVWMRPGAREAMSLTRKAYFATKRATA